MLRISTLGRLALDDESGPVGGAGSWRPTLAALALLASAGDQGLPRERVLSLIWPDVPPERGRNNLKQLLFALRRAVPQSAVAGTAILRLDRERVSCDLWEFRGALARGDLEGAVAAYAGPFLDGFSLPGAVEFERWAESERELLVGEFHRALSALAEQSMAAGNHRTAVAPLRRLAAAEPLDSAVALRLMLAMVAAGNRAGALQHFDVHAALVRQELECEPDPAAVEYADLLRSQTRLAAGAGSPGAASPLASSPDAASRATRSLRLVVDDDRSDRPAEAVGSSAEAAPPAAASARDEWTTDPARAGTRWPAPSRRFALAVAVLLLATAATTLGVARWRVAGAARNTNAPSAVAVMPFAVQGAASFAYLGPGLADLLSNFLLKSSALCFSTGCFHLSPEVKRTRATPATKPPAA